VNRTRIEYAEFTWNPITGCLNNCPYCYARKIAERFKGGGYGKEMGMFIFKYKDDVFKAPYELEEEQLAGEKNGWYRDAPYPFGFEPTFHKYRLDEPQQVKKPSIIFVGSMADMFGDWVPEEWITQVFEACKKAPQHVYLFLTKNPDRYAELAQRGLLPSGDNFWYGNTITGRDAVYCFDGIGAGGVEQGKVFNTFISHEPLLGKIDSGGFYPTNPDWVIVGAMTGAGSKQYKPREEWIVDMRRDCAKHGIPMFEKDNLRSVFVDNEYVNQCHLPKEYPKAITDWLKRGGK